MLDTSNALEKSMVESRESLGLLSADRPDLTIVKHNTMNCDTARSSPERKSCVMAVPYVSQVRERFSVTQWYSGIFRECEAVNLT